MVYGRLGSSEPMSPVDEPPPEPRPNSSKKRKLLLLVLSLVSLLLLLASGAAMGVLVRIRASGSGLSEPSLPIRPSHAISRACSRTRYPSLCVSSLVSFPGAAHAADRDLVHISVNMTLRHVGRALYDATSLAYVAMETRVRSAFDDCLELLEDSVDQLSRSLVSLSGARAGASAEDVLTWLSAALTNQDTCDEGLSGAGGPVKDEMVARTRNLAEMVSNCLAIFAGSALNKDFSGIPIQNRRRLMAAEDGFPGWVGRRERRLLQVPAAEIRADIVVSKDGNGTYKTIAEAIKAAPQLSNRRTVIYVKAGR